MKSLGNLRSLVQLSIGLALYLMAPVCFGAAKGGDEHPAQAQLLDHAEYLCTDCFFGESHYYFCFAADNKILVGYQSTPVFNFMDNSKNYLTRVRHSWAAWVSPGQSVPISYNEKYIWVTRDNGKKVRLTQSYSRDVFTSNDRCQAAIRAKLH